MNEVTFSMWGGLRSGRGDAEAFTYYRHVDASGRQWFVADAPDAGDRVYVATDDEAGFGGSIIDFTLTSGEVVKVKGPYLTNPDGLFLMTGVDVRDKCRTQGVVALEEREFTVGGPATYSGVIHYDETPVIGAHDRIMKIAQKASAELGKPVYMAVKGASGGHGRYVRPPAN